MIDRDAVEARYQAALDSKPSKGEVTQKGIEALQDSVADVLELLDYISELEDKVHEWEIYYE